MVSPVICKRINCPHLCIDKTIVSGVQLGRAGYRCRMTNVSTKCNEVCPRTINGDKTSPLLVSESVYNDKVTYPMSEYARATETHNKSPRFYIAKRVTSVAEYRSILKTKLERRNTHLKRDVGEFPSDYQQGQLAELDAILTELFP